MYKMHRPNNNIGINNVKYIINNTNISNLFKMYTVSVNHNNNNNINVYKTWLKVILSYEIWNLYKTPLRTLSSLWFNHGSNKSSYILNNDDTYIGDYFNVIQQFSFD